MPQLIIGLIILFLAIKYWPITLAIIILSIIVAVTKEKDKNTNNWTHMFNTSEAIHTSTKYSSNTQSSNKNINNIIKFYGKSEILELWGKVIQTPFIYVTDSNKNIKEYPHLVSTKLPVSYSSTSVNLGYWPSYSKLESHERGIFINWLQEGKLNPDINIGFVFIYFYGLEYRAIAEGKDLKDVFFETIRLNGIYGHKNSSFNSYSLNFIKYLIFKIKDFSKEEKTKIINFIENLTVSTSFIDKMSILYNLKDSIQDSNGLNEDIYNSLKYSLNSISSRYNGEDVFEVYLSMLLKEENNLLEYQYSTYTYYTATALRLNPNVQYKKVVASQKLKDVWIKAYNDLTKYTNTTQVKNPDGSYRKLTKAERYNYFPPLLKEYFDHPKIRDIEKLFRTVNYKTEVLSKLSEIIGLPYSDKFSLKQSKSLAEAYQTAGYLIEPDARIVNKTYKTNDKVIVFKSSINMNLDKNSIDKYSTACMFIDLGIKVSTADNHICDSEIEYMLDFVTEKFNIDALTQERLKNRMLLAREQEVNISGLLKKLTENTTIEDLQSIGKYFMCIAASDGIIKPEEVEVIKKYFKQLGLSNEYFENLLNELKLDTDSPVIIQEAQSVNKNGSTIPKQPAEDKEEVQQTKAIVLDKVKISNILADTSNVHKALQDIFSDKSAEEDIVEEPEEIEINDGINLASNYTDFINILLEKPVWIESELMGLCQDLGLMLNSALDKINEWTDQNFGDFLIEEDNDKYLINENIADLYLSRNREDEKLAV